MKKYILYISVISLIMLFVLTACGSGIINDDTDNYAASSEISQPELIISQCEPDIFNDNNVEDYLLSSEIYSSDEIADINIPISINILFNENVFVGDSERVSDGGGDELAWYYEIWGFGASGVSMHFVSHTTGFEIYGEWRYQFELQGRRNWREFSFVIFIDEFNLTAQDLIKAQEATYDRPMHEIETLVQWARYGEHITADERRDASFWRWSYSIADIEALVSNNVTAIWAAFPGSGIYQNGKAYSPEWVLNNIEDALIQQQLPPEEITRIIQHASDYPELDNIRHDAENIFREIMENIGSPTPTPTPEVIITLDIFNNGEGGSPSRPNANLAQSGTIRIWTQLDGVNTPLPMSAVITAVDENDNDAIEFVRINQRWAANQGWLDDFNNIDINKNAPWETITLSITVFDQTIEAILVNSLHTPETTPYFHTQVFEEYWRPIIVIWFYQGGPSYTNTHQVVIDDIVLYVDGERANIRDFANNVAPHQMDIPSLQIRRDLDWQEMTIIITELGQTITHTFTN